MIEDKTKLKSYISNKSHGDYLVDLILDGQYKLFTDQFGDGCLVDYKEPFIARKIRSEETKELLAKIYWNSKRKTIRPEIMSSVAMTLNGIASYERESREVYTRVAKIDDTIYYDIGDNINVVEINKDGWKIVDHPPVFFRRYTTQKVQVLPQRGGDVKQFVKYVNIDNEDSEILLCTYLATCLISDIERPLLLMHGPEKAGKTSALELIKSIIDPSRVPHLQPSKSEDDMIRQANRHYAYFMDNLSYIKKDISDTLCRFVTGTAFSKRALYRDDDEILYEFKRVTGITSIAQLASNADLLSRCLIIQFDTISDEKRISEQELNKKFNIEKPLIFGGLLDTVVKMLSLYKDMQFKTFPYRSPDYCMYAGASSVHLGYGLDKFIKAFENNKDQQMLESLDTSPTIQAILFLMKNEIELKFTSTQLYIKLKDIVEKLGLQSGFPKGVTGLWKKIQEHKATLQSIGIEPEKRREQTASKIILRKTAKYNYDLDDYILDQDDPFSTPKYLPETITFKSRTNPETRKTEIVEVRLVKQI